MLLVTLQSFIMWARCSELRVRSKTSLRRIFMKVGSLPLFSTSKFDDKINSSKASPLGLQLVLPQTVWWEFASQPICRGMFEFLL